VRSTAAASVTLAPCEYCKHCIEQAHQALHRSPINPSLSPHARRRRAAPLDDFAFLRRFAMKQLDKKRLKKEGQEMSVIHERNVLAEVSQCISLSVDGIRGTPMLNLLLRCFVCIFR